MAERLVAVLLAEGVAIDSISSRVTAFNMLDTVRALRFPAILPRLYVVTIYESEKKPPGDERLTRVWERVSIDGSVIGEVTSNSALEVGSPSHTSVHLFSAVKLADAGVYRVTVQTATSPSGPWTARGDRVFSVVLVHPDEIAQLSLLDRPSDNPSLPSTPDEQSSPDPT